MPRNEITVFLADAPLLQPHSMCRVHLGKQHLCVQVLVYAFCTGCFCLYLPRLPRPTEAYHVAKELPPVLRSFKTAGFVRSFAKTMPQRLDAQSTQDTASRGGSDRYTISARPGHALPYPSQSYMRGLVVMGALACLTSRGLWRWSRRWLCTKGSKVCSCASL